MENDSPFIKDTFIQFAWDSTSLGYAKECLRKYKYTIIDGWRKKDVSVHLRFGSEFARWLEFYTKVTFAGVDHEEALDITVAWMLCATADWKSNHTKKNRDTLIRSVIWYLDAYKDDPAKTLRLADGRPAVELSFKLELPWEAAPAQPYILCGHMDKIVDYAGDPFVVDQKSTSSGIGAYFFAQFNPDNQMSIYTAAGKAIFDLPIAGVIIDGVNVQAGYTDFARGFTTRTEGQMSEWLEETKQWTSIIKSAAERNWWPHNDKACNNYGGCVFREVCSQDPSVRENYLETSFEKVFWNPLVPR